MRWAERRSRPQTHEKNCRYIAAQCQQRSGIWWSCYCYLLGSGLHNQGQLTPRPATDGGEDLSGQAVVSSGDASETALRRPNMRSMALRLR